MNLFMCVFVCVLLFVNAYPFHTVRISTEMGIQTPLNTQNAFTLIHLTNRSACQNASAIQKFHFEHITRNILVKSY